MLLLAKKPEDIYAFDAALALLANDEHHTLPRIESILSDYSENIVMLLLSTRTQNDSSIIDKVSEAKSLKKRVIGVQIHTKNEHRCNNLALLSNCDEVIEWNKEAILTRVSGI
jgi:hypothetical protein